MTLITEISLCEEAKKAKNDISHPCHTIVLTQKDRTAFQLPEPWSGHIENAEILFISSNPSIGDDPEYPTEIKYNDDAHIEHYFSERFQQEYYKKVGFFKRCKKFAEWILNIPCGTIDDAKICLTEVVHCKSKKEKGVRKCCNFCIEKWTKKVISCFNGKYIVVLGAIARDMLKDFDFGNRIVITMPHPNARGVSDNLRKSIIENAVAADTHCVLHKK